MQFRKFLENKSEKMLIGWGIYIRRLTRELSVLREELSVLKLSFITPDSKRYQSIHTLIDKIFTQFGIMYDIYKNLPPGALKYYFSAIPEEELPKQHISHERLLELIQEHFKRLPEEMSKLQTAIETKKWHKVEEAIRQAEHRTFLMSQIFQDSFMRPSKHEKEVLIQEFPQTALDEEPIYKYVYKNDSPSLGYGWKRDGEWYKTNWDSGD